MKYENSPDELNTEKDLSFLSRQFQRFKLTFSKHQLRQFYAFYQMLVEKNRVMNLTGITRLDEVAEKHFLDSLSLCRVVDFHEPLRLLDLGTGAGFPGIPLKIAFPEIQITLVDSLNKRLLFLDEVIEQLGLCGIETVHARAEDLGHDRNFREKYDLCVSRAVANLCILEEYCLPFVRLDGRFIAYKSGDVDGEVSESKIACTRMGGELEEIYPFALGEQRRSFVIVRKAKETPGAYPRKAGMPSKKPLRG